MIKQKENCPICGEGHLGHRVEKNAVEYNGRSTHLDCHFSVCDSCGSELASPTQARDNKRMMIAFKKKVDGLLTGDDVKAIRQHLGINQTQAAVIFGGGPVAFSKYENDDVMQSESMDRLLRVASKFPDAFIFLAQYAGIEISYSTQLQYMPESAVYITCEDLIKLEGEKPKDKRPQLRLVHPSKKYLAQLSSEQWIADPSIRPRKQALC
jgi:HTH-type transcriptional regulator/antitoxin MqsA